MAKCCSLVALSLGRSDALRRFPTDIFRMLRSRELDRLLMSQNYSALTRARLPLQPRRTLYLRRPFPRNRHSRSRLFR